MLGWRQSVGRECKVEHIIRLHIEKLPENVYLATSDDVQGLVAQGRTIQETVEIARDVARRLIESQTGVRKLNLPVVTDILEFPLIVSA